MYLERPSLNWLTGNASRTRVDRKAGLTLAKKKYVIVGSGAAGISAAEAIRWGDPEGDIVIISEEPCPAYSKVLLHHYIGGDIDEGGLYIRSDKFYKSHGMLSLKGVKVKEIDRDKRFLLLADKSKMKFDELLIATGSSPWKPCIKGINGKGIHTLWTLNDARTIRSVLKKCREAIVIGASFVGMKVIDALFKSGLKITVVDIMDRIMPHSLDSDSSRLVQKHMEERGVRFYLGVRSVEIEDFEKTKKTLLLEDGTTLLGDMILVTTGAKPNIEIVNDGPIERNEGILVDETLRTNSPHIYAAGDCAEGIDVFTGERKRYGLWHIAVAQGGIAGLNMTGKNLIYNGELEMNAVTIFDFPVIMIGKTKKGSSNEWREEVFTNKRRIYRKFLFERDRLVGAILMGCVRDAGLIGYLIRSGVNPGGPGCSFSFGQAKLREIYLPAAS